jgi:hypothetical protein
MWVIGSALLRNSRHHPNLRMALVLQAAILPLLSTKRFGARSAFVHWTSIALATVGFVAVTWTQSPPAFLTACIF